MHGVISTYFRIGEPVQGRQPAKAGTPVAAIDSVLAATAAHAGLIGATRNLRDFSRLEVGVFNRWEF